MFLRNVYENGLWAVLLPWRHRNRNKLSGHATDMALPYTAGRWTSGFHYAAGWSSPHFRLDVLRRFNDFLPHRWIGQDAHDDLIFCPWPARSPDINPCSYLFWGYVEDKVFVPPQSASTPDLKNRITADVETITPGILIRVWHELESTLGVCRATKGAYIEHL